MLHAREDYNTTDLNAKIPADEPVFLIRGQDFVGGDAVRAWALLHEQAGGDPAMSQIARNHADRMDRWPKKKLADM
jgi:hypothetical protein